MASNIPEMATKTRTEYRLVVTYPDTPTRKTATHKKKNMETAATDAAAYDHLQYANAHVETRTVTETPWTKAT